MAIERLQKILAHAGVSSRRAAEDLILARRVRVNGRVVAELGAKADAETDRIEVDGTLLVAERFVYVLCHKPRNVVSTLHDPEGRPTVAELVRAIPARLYPVGRLDFATSGVLLFTNDGDFAQGLLHPKRKVPKTYVVKLDREIDDKSLEHWRTGVELEDGKTLPADVRLLRHENTKSWIEITLSEGRNHQIRRMATATGFLVMRLARTSFAGLDAEGVRPGQWRLLTMDELRTLKGEYGVPKRPTAQRELVEIEQRHLAERKKRLPRGRGDEGYEPQELRARRPPELHPHSTFTAPHASRAFAAPRESTDSSSRAFGVPGAPTDPAKRAAAPRAPQRVDAEAARAWVELEGRALPDRGRAVPDRGRSLPEPGAAAAPPTVTTTAPRKASKPRARRTGAKRPRS
ncbi:MAG: rRNA pseudouridine synthase [Myxococcales bacterium]|nr:rRNA pseudouridine synthase [Myxococcales bacterium]